MNTLHRVIVRKKAATGYKRLLWTLQDQDQGTKRENNCSDSIFLAALNMSSDAAHCSSSSIASGRERALPWGFPLSHSATAAQAASSRRFPFAVSLSRQNQDFKSNVCVCACVCIRALCSSFLPP